jgi:hypothetical protein
LYYPDYIGMRMHAAAISHERALFNGGGGDDSTLKNKSMEDIVKMDATDKHMYRSTSQFSKRQKYLDREINKFLVVTFHIVILTR